MLLSIIIPSYNEEGNIIELNKRITETLKNIDYEIIYIDDGSKDKTLEKIKQVAKDNDLIKYISFSRNFGKDAAIYAGLKKSAGYYTCIIDSDLQQNPKYIIKMLSYIKKHEEINQITMVMKNRDKENFLTQKMKNIFYKLINKLSDIELINGASDFRLFDISVKKSILSLSEKNRFTKGIFSWIGFNTVYMEYEVEQRYSGKSKFDLKNNIKYALTGITNYSIKPLYISSIIGFTISIISLIYIIIIVFKTLLLGKDIPGYASIIVLILLMGGLQLLFIGILGTYLGKTYIEVKDRPMYIEKETKGFDEIL